MKNNQSVATENSRETEDFFQILENCTPAQKQYFAGVLDGMKYSNAERRLDQTTTDPRTA